MISVLRSIFREKQGPQGGGETHLVGDQDVYSGGAVDVHLVHRERGEAAQVSQLGQQLQHCQVLQVHCPKHCTCAREGTGTALQGCTELRGSTLGLFELGILSAVFSPQVKEAVGTFVQNKPNEIIFFFLIMFADLGI